MTNPGRLLNISVRLPITVRIGEDGAPRFVRSTGGLATGLERAKGERESLWIGWPGIPAERIGAHRDVVDERLSREKLRAVHLNEHRENGFYGSVSNGVIWPVLHGQLDRLPIEVKRWDDYVAVNKQFAEAAVAAWREGDLLWVHDYQLMLVPAMIRTLLPNARIGFFLHVPFPGPDDFGVLPERDALLRGILGADVIGVHTHGYQRNMMSALRSYLGLRPGIDEVNHEGRTVMLGVFPMGVDSGRFARIAARSSVRALAHQLRRDGPEFTLLGIDRLDYTKGIPRRLVAFERLLERHPEWRERVRFLQVAVPSRTQVAAYARYREQVDGLVGRINGAFGTPSWTPVQYMYRSISQEELVSYYRVADVMLVTPIRDGMNLVAKEFIASRDDGDGVLVLSEFTGAADELSGALRVNPYDIERTAEALHRALTMSESERRERMRDLRNRVMSSTVQEWRKNFLDALEQSGKTKIVQSRAVDETTIERIANSTRLMLLLDYDGTVVPIRPRPEEAAPDATILKLLRDLASLNETEVHIVSGRRYQDLDQWFSEVPVSLHAEHGLLMRAAGSALWQRTVTLDDQWKPAVKAVLERFTGRTPGSFIEEKTAGYAWHYRLARQGVAEWQANELRAHLVELLAEVPVQVLEGKKVLEVRQEGVHKGLLAARLAGVEHPDTTLVAIGDDRTDDDMFAALPPDAVTIAVGDAPRRARWRLAGQDEVLPLLRKIIQRRTHRRAQDEHALPVSSAAGR